MRINDELILNIESLSNLGLGIAKPDGFVVFVSGGCPQDLVKAKVTKLTKNYAVAEVQEIITPSKHRVKPFCPLHKVCGACQLQFIDYEYQLKLKKKIVEDAIHSIAGLDISIAEPIPSPDILAFRHKVQYPVSQTKVSKRILAGYFKPSSHEIVDIKYCPIQPEICDRIMAFIRNNSSGFGISGYLEKSHTGDLRHVVLRVSSLSQKVLVTLVVNAKKSFSGIENFAKAIYSEFDEVSGVCLNFNSGKTNVILSENSKCIIGDDFVEEKLLDNIFKIGSNTFFQVNPKSAENIFRYVRNYLKEHFETPWVLDAYAGIATFGICVSDVCEKVVSVEANTQSCEFAKETVLNSGISNVEVYNMDAGQFMENETRKFDAVILDPPRKGCSQKSLDAVLRLCKKNIIYVSCNPATLARDLKYLVSKGARVESIQPFDMFCHTYHVENVAIISLM